MPIALFALWTVKLQRSITPKALSPCRDRALCRSSERLCLVPILYMPRGNKDESFDLLKIYYTLFATRRAANDVGSILCDRGGYGGGRTAIGGLYAAKFALD